MHHLASIFTLRAQHYDAVFLGDRTPTLLGAAFLARRGFRVLVLAEETLGERAGSPAFLLPFESPPVKALFEALALLPPIRRRVLQTEWAASIRLHDRSLDLPRDREARLAVFEREFPGSAAKLSRFERSASELTRTFDALLREGHGPFAEGFLARRAHRIFERRRASESFIEEYDPLAPLRSQRALLRALALLNSLHTALPTEELPPAAIAILYHRLLEGSLRVDGGEPWLRARLIESLADHGGTIERKRPLKRILTRRGRVDGVVFTDGRDEIGASMVIAGVREGLLRAYLDEPANPPERSLGTTRLEIPRDALPIGLGAHLYFKPRAPRAGGVSLYLERIEEPSSEGAREERRPAQERIARFELIALAGGELVARSHLEAALEELFPLSAEAIEFESPTMCPAPQSGGDDTRHTILDLAIRPVVRAMGGLYVAGPDSLPALGTEGEFLAIAAACRRALQSKLGRSYARFHPLRSLE